MRQKREKRLSARAAKFWRLLTSWYGTRLTDTYGTDCPEAWADVIDRTDQERIDEAMFKVKREHVKFPPSLPEFEACLPAKRQHDGKTPSLPALLSQSAIRQKALCDHQIAKTWSYFGPVEEFVSKCRENEIMQHPRIVGAVIPACSQCGKTSQRVTVKDIVQADRDYFDLNRNAA